MIMYYCCVVVCSENFYHTSASSQAKVPQHKTIHGLHVLFFIQKLKFKESSTSILIVYASLELLAILMQVPFLGKYREVQDTFWHCFRQ